MKKNAVFLLLGIILFGCAHEMEEQQLSVRPDAQVYLLKEKFSVALAKSLNDFVEVRRILKEESSRTFLEDNEILYQSVKNVNVIDGKTFSEIIESYLDNKQDLELLDQLVPKLCIYVPQLPENSFSAETWNIESEVPLVGINKPNSNDVTIFDSSDNSFLLEAEYIPGFPVVVVKETKKLITPETPNLYNKGGFKVYEFSGNKYRFLDDNLDKSIVGKVDSNVRSATDLDPVVTNAYYINNSYPIYGGSYHIGEGGWHRDYIYYRISNSSATGRFIPDFTEKIRSFKLMGDGMTLYNRLADQTADPRIITGSSTGWTAGGFLFKVKVILSKKDGTSEEIIKYFTAAPTSLFTVTYKSQTKWFKKVYSIETVTVKPEPIALNVDLFGWDIYTYATSFKLIIEEEDMTQTVQRTETRSVEFASNFETSVEGTIEILKIGKKFGGSLKLSRSQTTQVSYTEGNDDLGHVIVNFEDDVVTSIDGLMRWSTREYNSGIYSISVEPTRVQNF